MIVLPPEITVRGRVKMSLHRQTDCPWHVLVAEVILETRVSIHACAEREHHDEATKNILACSGGLLCCKDHNRLW